MPIVVEPIWISDETLLREVCERLEQQAAIAVDTEFMRTDTFYPIVGLVQINDGRNTYLIDPLALKNLDALKKLLLNEQVVKVLHSCSEDLEVFQAWLSVVPAPIFDTQIAAAFAELGYSLSYANLVKNLLSVEIPKDETRSDWLQRPLSASQVQYAALDVVHMLIVYGKLLQLLKQRERLAWVKEECALLESKAKQPDNYLQAYQKIGLAWKLRPQELAILRSLCVWRETEARARNIPRNRVIKENCLWDLARYKPQSLEHLQKIHDISSSLVRNHGETLLKLIGEALKTESTTWPSSLDSPLPPSQGPLLKALKETVRNIAESEKIPAELLIRKSDYEFIVRSGMKGGSYLLPERLKSWRYPLVGESLLKVCKDFTQDNTKTTTESERK